MNNDQTMQQCIAGLHEMFPMDRPLTPISTHWFGSRAYGLHTPESDYDVAMIVAYTLKDYVGFERPPKQTNVSLILNEAQININILDVRNVIANLSRMDIHHYMLMDSILCYSSPAGNILLDYADQIRDNITLAARELQGITKDSKTRGLRHQYRALSLLNTKVPRLYEPTRVDTELHETLVSELKGGIQAKFVIPDTNLANNTLVSILSATKNDQF